MTNDQIIHDLQAFADWFREERGVEPVCFSEAIRVITSQQKRIARDKKNLKEQIHGKWIVTESYPHKVYGQCSVCKQRKRIDNYCSNCGAKMDGGGQ